MQMTVSIVGVLADEDCQFGTKKHNLACIPDSILKLRQIWASCTMQMPEDS